MNLSSLLSRILPATKILLFINIIFFSVTSFFSILAFLTNLEYFNILHYFFLNTFSLIPNSVLNLSIWQIFTYQFLHANFLHIFFNMLVLWMMGNEIEEKMGFKPFLQYYLLCGFGAGILITLIPLLFHANLNIPTIGASGAIYGVMFAYAFFWPNRYILIWFVVPIKTKYLVIILGIISFLYSFDLSSNISHIGHLGGFITGYIYFLFKSKKINIFHRKKIPKDWYVIKNETLYHEHDIETTIDNLLSKISKQGLKNLTDRERSILDEYSKNMEKEDKIQ